MEKLLRYFLIRYILIYYSIQVLVLVVKYLRSPSVLRFFLHRTTSLIAEQKDSRFKNFLFLWIVFLPGVVSDVRWISVTKFQLLKFFSFCETILLKLFFFFFLMEKLLRYFLIRYILIIYLINYIYINDIFDIYFLMRYILIQVVKFFSFFETILLKWRSYCDTF